MPDESGINTLERCAHTVRTDGDDVMIAVRTKGGRLRKHSVLKSDWFLERSVILTCRKEQVIGMFIKEYRHSFRTIYFMI